jgi:8-oxo-dGTP pyrophosphatase MutT (NUDIX family)
VSAEQAVVGPWRREARRLVYDNAWIEVFHDVVVRPDGQPGVYGVVRPRSLAAGVVPIDDEGNVVLVGQHRYPHDRWSWEVPEGGVPFAEDPLVGVQRELREETGLAASTWVELGRLDLSNSFSDESAVLYLATGLVEGEAAPEPTEQLELRRVPFAEALAMAGDGRITDAMSVCALQWVALKGLAPC